MDEILASFEAALDALGFSVKVDSIVAEHATVQRARVHLSRGASGQEYALLSGPAVTFNDVARMGESPSPVLVFTTYLTSKTTDAFRRAGVQYLDTAGNAWVEFGEVLVDVRGHRRTTGSRQLAHSATGNLLSTGRAQVMFALLAWPQLWKAPQRELAHAAGVSLGHAHNALTLLTESGYGPDAVRPGQTELLDIWAAAFHTGLAKKLTLANYQGDIRKVTKVHADDGVFVSGEGAVDDLLRPATMTLYVEELDPRLPVVNKWRSDQRPNIVVRRKFWHAPDNTDAPLIGVRPVPQPLIYADLLNSDDPRVRAVATEWRDRRAGFG